MNLIFLLIVGSASALEEAGLTSSWICALFWAVPSCVARIILCPYVSTAEMTASSALEETASKVVSVDLVSWAVLSRVW